GTADGVPFKPPHPGQRRHAVAKNFRQEQAIFDTFTDVNERSYGLNLRQGFVFAAIFPILFLLTGTATALLLYFGGHLAFAGELTTGEWFLFITTVERLMFPMTSIASFWSQFQLGMAAAERVFALIDTEPLVVQHDNRPVPLLEGHIQFRDIHFRYSEQEQVLEDFNLDIAPGETVALVGHTGAGKSSLGKLVARFYEFQKGLLLVDGIDIRSFDLDAYHRQLGMVAQSPFLFSGTVRDNIRYGREDATDDAAEKAAHAVGGGFWLRSLPQGLDTETGEMGSSLSLGQRQLVALARLLVQDPRMIILDEATASVDPLTEAQIQEGLDLVLRDRTAIVIAHRLSTIQAADRIIVMRQGRIIEEGSHDSLMLQGGHYAELYATYFRHHAMDYELA
ncbi:MAG: ABC transporter ATP-binding protein, partial [Caldilineaceae bacterium]|nr:ABC transporter ATP-binding protein [Caldilineaceae bacterium]